MFPKCSLFKFDDALYLRKAFEEGNSAEFDLLIKNAELLFG